MNRLRTVAIGGWLCAFAITVGGCASGKSASEARRAEMAGDYHRAYDLYCQAASVNRNSRMIGLAISRVAPQAAVYWENKAHQAADSGDYREAWRCFMRVLEIRPDHPSAPHLIRRLERDHPEEIEPEKLAWLRKELIRRGKPTTALARLDPQALKPPQSRKASGRSPHPSVPKPAERRAEASSPGPKPLSRPQRRVQPSPSISAEPPRSAPPVTGTTRPDRPRSARARSQRRTELPSPSGPVVRRIPSSRPGARKASAPTSRPRTVARKQKLTKSEPRQTHLMVRTLSKEDRRFPRKAALLDGLTAEVRDTDDDPDADFNVYLAGKRIAKRKGIEIGEATVVPGRSGRVYRLVLLDVTHERHTIRLGVEPIRTRRSR